MNYLIILQKALRSVVCTVLEEVSREGLHSDTHFYITFKTDFAGVVLPKKLQEEYPFKMTIVLQHEFWNLEVFDSFFKVDLIFDNKVETIQVPFNAIYRFEDPSGPFALDLMVDHKELAGTPAHHSEHNPTYHPMYRPMQEHITKPEEKPIDNVISLDAFRKKQDEVE